MNGLIIRNAVNFDLTINYVLTLLVCCISVQIVPYLYLRIDKNVKTFDFRAFRRFGHFLYRKVTTTKQRNNKQLNKLLKAPINGAFLMPYT